MSLLFINTALLEQKKFIPKLKIRDFFPQNQLKGQLNRKNLKTVGLYQKDTEAYINISNDALKTVPANFILQMEHNGTYYYY